MRGWMFQRTAHLRRSRCASTTRNIADTATTVSHGRPFAPLFPASWPCSALWASCSALSRAVTHL